MSKWRLWCSEQKGIGLVRSKSQWALTSRSTSSSLVSTASYDSMRERISHSRSCSCRCLRAELTCPTNFSTPPICHQDAQKRITKWIDDWTGETWILTISMRIGLCWSASVFLWTALSRSEYLVSRCIGFTRMSISRKRLQSLCVSHHWNGTEFEKTIKQMNTSTAGGRRRVRCTKAAAGIQKEKREIENLPQDKL